MQTKSKSGLCKELEQIALTLRTLLRGEAACCDEHNSTSNGTIGHRIIAAEREMMRICRELIRGLQLDDTEDVKKYVSALNSSRQRFRQLGLPIAG